MSKGNGSEPPKLSPKHEGFCQRYVTNGYNASEAYVFVGYSPNGASAGAARLLAKVSIEARVEELMDGGAERAELTVEWIIEKLEENIARALTNVPVTDAIGNPIGIYTYQGNVANKALELLGKHLRMFDETLWHGLEDNRPQPGVMLGERKYFYTCAEVAKILVVSKETVRNWFRNGTLEGVRIGNLIRFRSAVIDKLVTGDTVDG